MYVIINKLYKETLETAIRLTSLLIGANMCIYTDHTEGVS